MSLEDTIIQRLNAELGDKVENLSKSKNLVDKYLKQLDDINDKISPDSDKISTVIEKTLDSSLEALDNLSDKFKNVEVFEEKIAEKLKIYSTLQSKLKDNLGKIYELEHLLEYFRVLQDIQDISSELTSCINSRDEQKIVNLFLSLSGDPNSSSSILGRMQETNAPNLNLYTRSLATHWHTIIKEKLSIEFENILKNIKWPNLGNLLDNFNPSRDILNKLSSLAEYLFMVQLPGYDRFMYVKLAPSIVCPPISTPIELLVKPFKLRFEYHFMGTRQTNRPDKPEWFFTQILSWAKDNHIFVGEIFQDAANRACVSDNIRLEFVRGLVQLTIVKLLQDIEEMCMDEQLFAHLIDEILSFEQDLKSLMNYPSTLPSAISVLTQPFYFTKWLSIEEKFTSEKMDQILNDENNPWELLDPFGFNHITSPLTAASMNTDSDMELDDLKIPKCADQFVRLLEAMKERYCCLPQPKHQLLFLGLQIELIDNFRRRLVQLHNHTVNTSRILNAIFYVNSVLREWGENVHYLHLHASLIGPNAEEVSSVFDKSISELEHWQKKLIKQLASKAVDEIKARSMSYRHDHWVNMPKQNANESSILSYSAGEMFQLLVTSLHDLESDLSTVLFNSCLRLIAKKLDDFFIDSMVMNTKFSDGGSAQFRFDISRNLLPLFGQYSRRPGLLFKNISDACTLLTLPYGTAMLLHETLKSSNKTTNQELHMKMKDALKEVGAVNLPLTLAVDVLERRTDICY
ncbi:unnamed protein product [Diamesa tonsa]